jgi:hypothetical protein
VAADAELPQDAGLVALGTDLAVSAECFLQVPDGLIPVAAAAVQDAEVLGGRGAGPRIGVRLAASARQAGSRRASPPLWAAPAAKAGNPGTEA